MTGWWDVAVESRSMKNMLALLVFVSSFSWAQSRFDGTWEMKMDTLEFSGPPEEYVLSDGMFHCLSCIPKVDVKADGTRQKVIGQLHFDTMLVRVVDANSVEFAYWKNGTPTFACTEIVSADGGSKTEEFTETPATERVTGHAGFTRVRKGPTGSHALSGAWEMHTVKNVSSSGPTTTYKTTKEGMAVSAGPEHFEAKFDGKDYPLHEDLKETDQVISLKLVDQNTLEETAKRDGKVTGVTVRTISIDGKSMRVTSTDKQRGKTMIYTAEKRP
jgi:hypothetical protein